VFHPYAALTPAHRLRVGRLVVEEGWSVAAAADHFRVSWPTAKRWSDRYRDRPEGAGLAPTASAMVDRSSRPHSTPHSTPNRTPEPGGAGWCTCGGSDARDRS